MADAPRHEITPGQLAGFLLSAQLGLGILGLPRYAVEALGHAGWWLVLGLGLLSILGTAVILALGGRCRASIVGANRMLFGKIWGFLMNLLVFAALFASSLANLALYIQAMKLFFFREMPLWILAVFLVAPVFYQIAKGLRVVARFDTFVYLAVLFLLTMILSNARRANWSFLFPLARFRPADPADLARTVAGASFGFLGYELMMVVYPRVKGDPRPAAFLAVGTAVSLLTLFAVFSTAFFGEFFLAKQVFPLFSLVRTWQAPVVERLDIYFLMFWLPAMAAGFTAFLAATHLVGSEIFPHFPRRGLLLLLGGLLAAGAVLLRDFDTTEAAARLIAGVNFFFFGLFLPALLLFLARLKGSRG